MRKTRWLFLVLLLLASIPLFGCDSNLVPEQQANLESTGDIAAPIETRLPQPEATYRPTVFLSSYNIQVFGQSKLEDSLAMDVLTHVATRFDVMAIQEIRSKKQDVMPRFVENINRQGLNYDFLISERLGRTVSKEQYAFLYDATRIEPIDEPFVVPDVEDWVHREPFVCRFRVRGLPADQAFTFVLINIHTDPDLTDDELAAMASIYQYVKEEYPTEDDFIVLGDLNEDENHLGPLGRIPGIMHVIGGQPTNTAMTKTYDNILFERHSTGEFTGLSGVFPLIEEYQLRPNEATRVSDHLPIWAEFKSSEDRTGTVAARPTGVIR